MPKLCAVLRPRVLLIAILVALPMTLAVAQIHNDLLGNRVERGLICPAGGEVTFDATGNMLRATLGQAITGRSESRIM